MKWIHDDTLDEEEEEDSEWEEDTESEAEDEPMEAKIQLPKGSKMTVQLIIGPEAEMEEETEDPFIQHLMNK